MKTRQKDNASHKASSILKIDGNSLTLECVEECARKGRQVELAPDARAALDRSRAVVDEALSSGKTIYGITTGFGKFKDVVIRPEDSRKLQRNLIVSHAAGMGDPLAEEVVRAMLLLRANALSKGFSGIRCSVVELLLECLNQRIHPLIPEQGSLGASGDLAPLAHMSLVLIGQGKAFCDGKIVDGALALEQKGLKPVELEAKEGLALTNGTQLMSALGCLLVQESRRLAKMADIIGAMSLEAQLGTPRAFAEKIHAVRPHPGQLASSRNLRRLLEGSKIVESHVDCSMVQDAYSLRCMPQVHGASRQTFEHAAQVLEIEINAATDNPLVFPDEILSGGNFHGQPLALVLDYLGIGLAELANISERRTERMVNPALSNGLPAFLTTAGGLESGFMIAQYTAASMVSENKVLAHPASVDSIPTSANQEDHVSMGATAGRKARTILANTRKVLAIELLCAAQAIEFRMHPELFVAGIELSEPTLSPGAGLVAAHQAVRRHIPRLIHDRQISLDMEAAVELLSSGELLDAVESAIGALD